MDSDWESLTLKQAGISLIDCDHRTPTEAAKGLPYVAIPQLRDGRILISEARKISEADFNEWTRKANPKAHDVVLSRRCNPGESAYVPAGIRFALGQNLVLLRSDATRVHPAFLRWLVKGPEWWRQVDAYINVGAIFTSLKCADIPKFQLTIPPLDKQLRISACLSSVDDKINLNRQVNQTLEAMAQAIFKSWFVDFDPVKAKIAAIEAGQDPLRAAMSAISGKTDAELDAMPRPQYDELAATAALFPDELVESELGDVPKGWEVKPISDVANIVMGQSPDGESYNNSGDGMALINGPVEFGYYHPKRIKWTTQITKISQVGDLIVCVRGSTTGRFVKSDGIYCLGRGVCAIRAHKSDWQPFVDQTYHFSLTALLSLATGSTFPSWNGPTLKNYRILLPSSDLITRFSTALHPISSQISINEGASTVLSELRDTLLPKLLSGELSVDISQTQQDTNHD